MAVSASTAYRSYVAGPPPLSLPLCCHHPIRVPLYFRSRKLHPISYPPSPFHSPCFISSSDPSPSPPPPPPPPTAAAVSRSPPVCVFCVRLERRRRESAYFTFKQFTSRFVNSNRACRTAHRVKLMRWPESRFRLIRQMWTKYSHFGFYSSSVQIPPATSFARCKRNSTLCH